jgi:hypothetical protein
MRQVRPDCSPRSEVEKHGLHSTAASCRHQWRCQRTPYTFQTREGDACMHALLGGAPRLHLGKSSRWQSHVTENGVLPSGSSGSRDLLPSSTNGLSADFLTSPDGPRRRASRGDPIAIRVTWRQEENKLV